MKALISVSDKEGIVEFSKGLIELGWEIISTGGTAKELKKNGLEVIDVSNVTGFPEIMDGRVKTLHPKIHGGLLALRKKHVKDLKENNIDPIDMVVCNFYPFEKTILKKDVKFEDAIENIDIGGPSMIRSAAKNFKYVLVVTDKNDYKMVLDSLKKGDIDEKFRKKLAVKAYKRTGSYDVAISDYLNEELFPERFLINLEKVQDLRYGENPHQKAAFYREPIINEASIINIKQHHGKELSYNNIMDSDAALSIVKEFPEPACAVIKHANPCGASTAQSIDVALTNAYNADPLSAFGCVIAINRLCDLKCAEFLKGKFVEVLIAPGFDDDALKILKEKKNIRLLELPEVECIEGCYVEKYKFKKVIGGMLIQTRGLPNFDENELKVVTKRKPSEQEIRDMIFAAKICRHVKSNSVLYAKNYTTVGIGAGQMSRVDSTMIATRKSDGGAKGAVMASDAFFPFRDGIDEAGRAGIKAIIQPGGSIRDQEVIDAADEYGIAMVFSGVRLFLH